METVPVERCASLPFSSASSHTEPSAAQCVHALVQQQLGRAPDAISLVCGDAHLTRASLNERANRLARTLQSYGVGPEVVVAICTEPSIHGAIGVLGIGKAGGAYVNLPPSLPHQRILDCLCRANARLVVTTSALRPSLAASGIRCVCVDDDDGPVTSSDTDDPRAMARLDNAAFIRFTSGSTGQPKAVINSHRSIVNRLMSPLMPDIRHDDTCALHPTAGYGARFFCPLALGARVVILSDRAVQDAAMLIDAIRLHGISSMYMVPTLLRQVLCRESAVVNPLECVRAIAVGGESLGAEIVDRFWRVMPRAILVSLYGSNEIGTSAAMRLLTPEAVHSPTLIGDAIANTRVHMLDSELQPVPPGGVAEICVASPHLARGYLGSPGLTASRFVADPWGEAGSRLYRSGDLARRLPNGAIEFIGRVDDQVKIRGFRVEIAEVEAALAGHHDVAHAAVVTRQFGEDTRLVAYAVPKSGVTLQAVALRDAIRHSLPSYMVPSAFNIVEALPLTTTGKVDRQALRARELERPEIEEYEAPRTQLEAQLTTIWEAVLGVRGIGIHDSFVTLGGDSLIALRIVATIEQELRVDLPAVTLFEQPTIACVAEEVRGLLTAELGRT